MVYGQWRCGHVTVEAKDQIVKVLSSFLFVENGKPYGLPALCSLCVYSRLEKQTDFEENVLVMARSCDAPGS